MMLGARRTLGALALAGGLAGCLESAREPVSLELRARGGPVDFNLTDGTRVVLSRADLAFGPFYLCAGTQAGQSCQTALAEWREAAVFDVLAPELVTLGSVEGYSGRALSYMHDCGIVSLLTAKEALVLPAAEDLSGHSLEVVGQAELDTDGTPSIPFRIALTLASSQATDRGQPVVRSSPGQVDVTIAPESQAVTISIDAAAWLEGLDRSTFWQDAACDGSGPDIVCAGTVSQDCATGDSTDCAALGDVCAPSRGCQDAVSIDQDSEAGRAIAQAITLSAGLRLEVE